MPPKPSSVALFLLVSLERDKKPGLHCVIFPPCIGNQVGGISTIKNRSSQETLWSWQSLVEPLCCYGESHFGRSVCCRGYEQAMHSGCEMTNQAMYNKHLCLPTLTNGYYTS